MNNEDSACACVTYEFEQIPRSSGLFSKIENFKKAVYISIPDKNKIKLAKLNIIDQDIYLLVGHSVIYLIYIPLS